MQFYGKATETAQKILDAFRNGEIEEPMANVFLTLKTARHSASWSLRNQLIMFLSGYSDGRGYQQWRQAGRQVKTGEKAFYILAPMVRGGKKKKNKQTGKTEREGGYVSGFKGVPVFGLEQTDGDPIEGQDEVENWIAQLPLIEVAQAWGIKVNISHHPGALGHISNDGKRIGLAVENLATWAHEMIHAADIRLGNLTEKGQHWRSETVAELGGCILLECLGYKGESDRGGAFKYIQRYAQETGKTAQDACCHCLSRTLAAVEYLLEAAEKVQEKAGELQAA